MSLAMYAAPFDNDINQINTNSSNNDNLQGRKKVVNNKTIKKYPKDNEKVNSVLQSIQNLPSYSSSSHDDGNFLGDFTPLPPPSSAGVENTRIKEQTLQNKQQDQDKDHLNYGSKINSGTDLDDGYPTNLMYQQHSAHQAQSAQSTHSLQPQQSHMMPNYAAMYSSMNGSGYGSSQSNGLGSTDSHDLLLQKLNYMINLLEQSQDERTNNVTEEIVLYSFLGIFIIFIIDSFVRVGKYVR
jgi:hypothetical protein